LHQKDNGPLRPDIVLYDEGIKQEDIVNSVKAMQQADLVVIVGTFDESIPICGLARLPQSKCKGDCC
jgi:NAD-dependent deacetylase